MWMKEAINQALNAKDDVPVGAVVVNGDKIISFVCNEKELNNDSTAHAEILAIRRAQQVLGSWRLDGCTLYVTLEPCPMCASAIIQARLDSVCFGSYDKLFGALGSAIDLRKLHHSTLKVYGGIMEQECDLIINSFWSEKRK